MEKEKKKQFSNPPTKPRDCIYRVETYTGYNVSSFRDSTTKQDKTLSKFWDTSREHNGKPWPGVYDTPAEELQLSLHLIFTATLENVSASFSKETEAPNFNDLFL